MSGFLAAGSVVVIAALWVVLVVYLYKVGVVVQHLAETLSTKVDPGAAEVAEHVSAIGPAAAGLRNRLAGLRHLHPNMAAHAAQEG